MKLGKVFRFRRAAPVAFAIVTCACPCEAGLVWSKTKIQLDFVLRQETASVAFPFRVEGEAPVRIASVTASCSCTVATLAKESYAPGEAGELKVVFTAGGQVGPLMRQITVTADDAARTSTVLTLLVEIPEPVAIRPRFLLWEVGREPEEKAIEIAVAEPKTTTLDTVSCSSAAFTARLEPAVKAGVYRLRVKPASTRANVEGAITLNATLAGRPEVFSIYVAAH